MKKVIVSLCMAGALIALSSCRSSKDAATLSSIDGEWNIIEINGAAVVPAPNQEFPFIGFDTNTGKVFGNSGCNRMMGSFDVNAKPGTIDLGAMASTRMACPDMTLEQNVLSALGQVKKYKKLGKENIALCGSSNRPIIVLQKKASTVKLSDLSGKWIISEAGGQSIPEGMEKQPFIEFNLSEKIRNRISRIKTRTKIRIRTKRSRKKNKIKTNKTKINKISRTRINSSNLLSHKKIRCQRKMLNSF